MISLVIRESIECFRRFRRIRQRLCVVRGTPCAFSLLSQGPTSCVCMWKTFEVTRFVFAKKSNGRVLVRILAHCTGCVGERSVFATPPVVHLALSVETLVLLCKVGRRFAEQTGMD